MPSGRRPNWWLRLTSFGWDRPQRTVEERERVRRSRLMSWIILGLFVVDVVLLPLGFSDPTTLAALVFMGLSLLVATALNRIGRVSAAGLLLVVLICAADIGTIASYGDLSVDMLPIFDLLVVAVVVAASVLPRAAAFGVAALNIGLICLDFLVQHPAKSLTDTMSAYGDGSLVIGAVALLARPVGLEILIAVVAYLWVRGTDEAIRRADRAEEIAALEHSIAEQKRQLDIGIQQLLQTHVRAANGDFTARAPLRQDNILWQIGSSLNNLLARMQRAAQAEHQFARTQEELRRLAAAIDDAQAGRQPLWPAPTGTPADLILERIARTPRRRSVPTAPYEHGQIPGGQTPGGMGWPSISSQPLSQSPYAPSSQPLTQSPYAPSYGSHGSNGPQAPHAPDSWQMPDQVDDAHALPNPWQLPAEQLDQPPA